MPGRVIAIGDIHGCSLALSALIDAITPGPEDLVIPLGDYVDRGPDCRGVIEQLLALEKRCRLVPILGNHEEMLLEAVDSDEMVQGDAELRFRTWLALGGLATLDSYGEEGRIPPHHLAFFRSCRDYVETDTHIFVHASYAPALPMDEQPAWTVRWDSLRDGIPSPHVSGKTVIVGHTAQMSGEIFDLGHLKCIDTYCYGGGWLTALDVASGRVWQTSERGERRA